VIVFARGDWCPFCRAYANEWQQKKKYVEEHNGTISLVSAQDPAKIPDSWALTSPAYPDAFNLDYYTDKEASLGSALGVVVEEPMGHKSEYANGKMAQPGVFILRVRSTGLEMLVRWAHISKASNLYGAIGRPEADDLLKEAFQRMESKDAPVDPKSHAVVHSHYKAFPKFFISKIWNVRAKHNHHEETAH